MAVAKRYPIEINKEKKETIWKEFYLTETESKKAKQDNIENNIKLISRCLDIAKGIARNKEIQKESSIIEIAKEIFNKNAQHVHYHEQEILYSKQLKSNSIKYKKTKKKES